MLQLLLIAVSLALDAMAVSVSVGMTNPQAAWKQGLRMGLWFGGFQFGMPLLGFLLGHTLSSFIATAAPFIAFALLAFVGGRMVLDAWQNKDCEVPSAAYGQLTVRKLLALAVATSIDALAVGVTFAFSGGGDFCGYQLYRDCDLCVFRIGNPYRKSFGIRFKSRAELAGGVILMGMGLKILLEHLGILG